MMKVTSRSLTKGLIVLFAVFSVAQFISRFGNDFKRVDSSVPCEIVEDSKKANKNVLLEPEPALPLSSTLPPENSMKGHHAGPAPSTHLAPFTFPQLYRCPKTLAVDSGVQSMSQSNEDRWLWDRIFSKLPQSDIQVGTFVEIGALDGRRYSNTWFFEHKLDWRGALIEGHPTNQPLLRKSQDARPNSAIFTTAVCNLTADGQPGSLTFTNRGDAVGASIDHAAKDFLSFFHRGQDSTGLTVACIPMQSILDLTGLLDIDLFSLDVEGAELEVLQTIDWDRTNIRVLVVELDNQNPGKDQRVRDLLTARGFKDARPTLGSIRDACTPGGDCTVNEVFLKDGFAARKAERIRRGEAPGYYMYGTGMRCPTSP